MDSKYLFLQTKVYEGLSKKYGYFSIPDFDLTFNCANVDFVSEALYPLMKCCVNKANIKLSEKIYDKERIEAILKIIENQFDNNIIYISLIGKQADEAFNALNKKYSMVIVKNEYHEPIIKNEEIYIPIINNSICDESLRILSHLNVTVTIYTGVERISYFLGEQRSVVRTDALTLTAFVTSRGFFIDEYLYGQIIYYLDRKDPNLAKKILNNLSSKFAQSLIKMHEVENFATDVKSIEDRAEKLGEVLEKVDFELIKDKDYEFVEFYC